MEALDLAKTEVGSRSRRHCLVITRHLSLRKCCIFSMGTVTDDWWDGLSRCRTSAGPRIMTEWLLRNKGDRMLRVRVL